MRTQIQRCRWPWVRVGLGLLVLGGLASGCGGQPAGGDANFSQKFEQPTGEIPKPKVVPETKSPRDVNDLSPRERRALSKVK